MSTEALRRCARKKVSVVARSTGEAAEELYKLAMGNKQDWTRKEWNDVLQSLDACDDTVDDYLSLRE